MGKPKKFIGFFFWKNTEFSKKISWSEKLQKLLSLALIAYNLLPDFMWNIISFICCFYIYESLNFQVHYIYAYSSKRASITTTKLVFQHFYLDTWLSKVKLCLLVSHSLAFLYSWRCVRYSQPELPWIHTMTEVGRDLWRPSCPTPFCLSKAT